jgi:hypothetical protein
MPASADPSEVARSVSWQHDATTRRWLRLPLLLGLGVVDGIAVLVAGAVLAMLAFVLLTGTAEARLLVVLFALIGGPLSLVYLLPVLRDPAQRPSFLGTEHRQLSGRQRAAVGVVGAAVLALSWWLDPRLAAIVAGLGVLGGAVYALSATRGTIDPEDATLRVAAREYDLAPVTGYRTRRFGPVALVTVSAPNRPGRFGRVPSRFRVPTDRLDEVTAALDGVVATAPSETGRPSNPAVRLVAGGMALLFLAVGVAAAVLVDGVVGWYVAAVCGLFAVILLAVAREG